MKEYLIILVIRLYQIAKYAIIIKIYAINAMKIII